MSEADPFSDLEKLRLSQADLLALSSAKTGVELYRNDAGDSDPGFATEKESAAAFDRLIEATGFFHVYSEVPGWYFNRRMFCNDQAPRIDRILAPTQRLIELGWRKGDIGIELKKSGTKLKDVLNQALDYRGALFDLPNGRLIGLRQVFIWPFTRQTGPIESIIAQNRIGTVSSRERHLRFMLSATTVLGIETDATVYMGAENMGRKVGSR